MIVVPPWLLLLSLVRTLPTNSVSMPNIVDLECFTDDATLVRTADSLYKAEQLLGAARVLRQVRNPGQFLTDHHLKVLRIAEVFEDAIEAFLAPPGEEWKKQGESHGDYETSIYYKIESGGRLTCRIETPIPKDMLVPILSVLNESSLYPTWIPSWTRPVRLGVRNSKQVLNDRKGHQVIHIQCDVPWPMASREVFMDVIAVDDIEETGCIIAKMQTIEEHGDQDSILLPDGFVLPRSEKGSERVDFDGSILFRACPTDHPLYEASRQKLSGDLILLQYTMYFDAKMAAVPHSVINFVTRVVIGMIWSMLLKVAEEVKSGQRKEHAQIIRQKADFYGWLERRCELMLNSPGFVRKTTPLSLETSQQSDWTMKDILKLSI